MQWTDQAIVLSLRRHGETSALLSLLTAEHGRFAGLVQGGAGRAARAALQAGNRLHVVWKARLAEQLGAFTWEAVQASGTQWLGDPTRLLAVASACALAEHCVPEREPSSGVFNALSIFLDYLTEADWPAAYVRWELALLSEIGFGLDLETCAATGTAEDLCYVSPKSGRAVSSVAGAPYRDRLLVLPAFLCYGGSASVMDIVDGLTLTGYFLNRYVSAPRGLDLPVARSRLVDRLGA